MDRRRIIASAAAVGFLFVAVWSGFEMARRLVAFMERHGRVVYAFRPVVTDRFEYAGRPVVFEDQPPTESEPYGAVVMRYDEETVRMRVTVQPLTHAGGLPGVVRHDAWMRVLRFAPLSGRTDREFASDLETGLIEDRLAVVTRNPPPGAEPRTWGQVWRKGWTFDIYELLPDGGVRHERFAYPQGRPYSEDAPREHMGLPVLRPEMWQYDASLHVMPEGSGPRIAAADGALRSVGWTLPVASLGVFAFVAAALVAIAPRRRGDWDGEGGARGA